MALLRRDAELRLRYESVRQRGFADFQQLFSEFVTAGVLVPLDDPKIVTNLAEEYWLISEFWLSSVEISGERVTAQQMQHGVELMMQVMEAYLGPTGGNISVQPFLNPYGINLSVPPCTAQRLMCRLRAGQDAAITRMVVA